MTSYPTTAPSSITVQFNGAPTTCSKGMLLIELLQHNNAFNLKHSVVTVNQNIIHQKQQQTYCLQDRDCIEILTLAPGG